jgi:LDH2 family malate/lactate/ureidoglycolate dehydrogenase
MNGPIQEGMQSVPAAKLREFVARLFTAAGVPAVAAANVAEGLVEAELEGLPSHGVMLTDMYIERLQKGSVSRGTSAVVVSERQGAIVLDAGHALGQLTGMQAMGLAIDKARQFAGGIVSVRHGFHFGTAGRYARQAAEAGCVGIAMCNTRPLMPAPGGAERVVGNNPIAIALPTAGDIPIVLDMATSEAAMGKIRMAEKAKEAIPPTWAVTADGSPTTDPSQAIAGMLLPSGGAKGFGLSFLIDLLCGLLSQGATGAEVRPLYGDFSVPYDCSHLFIAIDVAHFGDLDWFRRHAAAAAERVRCGQRAPGVEQLFTPGEPEWRQREKAAGRVKLDSSVVEMLRRYAHQLGVTATPFENNLMQEMPHA